MDTNDLRQPYVLEDFLNSGVMPSEIVAARAVVALEGFRPDPTTGRQEPGLRLSFGLANLDEMIQMLRGKYYLVAARPRTGKSAFAMQIVETVMAQLVGTGRTVVIFSAEMDAEGLALREACASEGLSFWDMVRGKLTQEQYDRLHQRAESNGRAGYYLDESSSPSIEHMVAELDAIVKGGQKIGLVVFDYLQLAGETDKDETRRIARIGRGLKRIAKRFDCAVLALAQLNREIERRKEGQPQLADLMYGGEQDPDGIILLHRPWLQDNTRPKEMMEVWVPKHRWGPGGYCLLAFDEVTMRFSQAILRRVELNEESGSRPGNQVRATVGKGPAASQGTAVRPSPKVAGGLRPSFLPDDD